MPERDPDLDDDYAEMLAEAADLENDWVLEHGEHPLP